MTQDDHGAGEAPGVDPAHPPRPGPRSLMCRVFLGGVVGGLPGTLLALVPPVLAGLGVITGDQSQIGFVGLPLLVVGIAVGTATAASDSGCVGPVLLGVAAGFLAGLAVTATLAAVAVGLPGVLAVPTGMIAGAVVGAHRCGRHRPRAASPDAATR